MPDGPVSVEFDHVRFGYPAADKVSLASLEEVAMLDTRGGVEVLHDVSFRAEPGRLVALVGTSGTGKSTIAQLTPRLYDVDEGAVRSAVDVRDLSFESIRATLGMVTQDGHLFHDCVRGNLPSPARRRPTTSCGTPCARPAGRRDRVAARRARHRGGRARLPAPAASASA